MLINFHSANRLIRLFYSPDAAPGGGAGGAPAGTAGPSADAGTLDGDLPETPEGEAGPAAEKPEKKTGPKKAGRAAPPAAPTREADDSAYARIVAKAEKDPNYEMSDAEAEVFGRVSERGDADKPKQPKAKQKAAPEELADEPEPDPEESDKGKDKTDPDDDDPDAGDEAVPKGLAKFVGEKSPFGAKTAKELPAKLEEFSAKFKQLTAENANVGRLNQRLEKQTRFIQDLAAGKPEAIAFAKEHKLGYNPAAHAPKAAPGQKPGVGADGKQKPVFLDDDMAAYVATLEEKVSGFEARFQKFEQRDNQARQSEAHREVQDGIINEMATLAEKYPELAVKGGSLRELAKEYMTDPKLDKVDPRLKNLAQVLHLAADQNLPTLEAAYAMWRLQTHPQTVIDAERRGRESLAKNLPSRGLSDRQGGSTGQYQAYTDEDINAFATGAKEVPDEWLDGEGNLDFSKLPKRLRDKHRADIAEIES